MTTIPRQDNNPTMPRLYMAMELSNKSWKLGFSDGAKNRQMSVAAGDWPALSAAVKTSKERFGLAPTTPVFSCYEAGRDGFWIHRALMDLTICNVVIDSSSIEVNRRQRRAKTDSVDVKALLRLLQRYLGGEHSVMSVVRVPSPEQEDRRRLHRERERLVKERGSHSSRIQALLVMHGIRITVGRRDIESQLTPHRALLGPDLRAELDREVARYQLVDDQIKALDKEQKRRVKDCETESYKQIDRLMQLKGVGWQSSWMLVMEFFNWRAFRNRRELAACAGLTPTPYDSGDSRREQGISKAGNRRIRRLMVELSWMWLRHQPESELSQWYERRYAHGGKRMRRIGIVAMARKLLISLWRYHQDGVVPAGAVMSS